MLFRSLSPGGKFIVSGSDEGLPWNSGRICLWNSDTGELVKELKLSSRVNSVAFSPVDEQLIAFGTQEGEVRVWDVTDDVAVTIGNHREFVYSFAVRWEARRFGLIGQHNLHLGRRA